MGHFHCLAQIPIEEFDIFMNGAFVTDDEYVLKRLGWGSHPFQWLCGVHPRTGVTWRYKLFLEKKRLQRILNDSSK